MTALAQDTGATPYMVLLAAFGVLIHRYTHTDDFLVAAPVLNRDRRPDDVIGYYGNTVAMRLRPQTQSDIPRTAGRRPATPRSARSPISGSTSTGWCASSTPTAATARSG